MHELSGAGVLGAWLRAGWNKQAAAPPSGAAAMSGWLWLAARCWVGDHRQHSPMTCTDPGIVLVPVQLAVAVVVPDEHTLKARRQGDAAGLLNLQPAEQAKVGKSSQSHVALQMSQELFEQWLEQAVEARLEQLRPQLLAPRPAQPR